VYANFIVEKQESETDSTVSRPLQPELVEASGPSPESGAKPSAHSTNRLSDLVLPKVQPEFPLLALIVSGGHTQLALFRDHGDFELIGRTQDDAVGEAYDKVAKIIGLPYPGGPSIASAAQLGDPHAYKLPKAKLANDYDFSFSGLKTATLRAVQREVGVDITFPSFELAAKLSDQQRNDFAASFMYAANETLVDKTVAAFHEYQPKSVVIAGGVAADRDLRQRLADRLPIGIEYAPIKLCTDNAAMVGALGYYVALKRPPVDPRDLEVVPSLSMSKTAWAEERA
jgi:N6-L-threonylcarbamoyladenine synthase